MIFIRSDRLVNCGTNKAEGSRCALLFVCFALHSSGWKVSWVLFIVDIVVIIVIFVNAVIVLVVIAFRQVMGRKKQQHDSFGSV